MFYEYICVDQSLENICNFTSVDKGFRNSFPFYFASFALHINNNMGRTLPRVKYYTNVFLNHVISYVKQNFLSAHRQAFAQCFRSKEVPHHPDNGSTLKGETKKYKLHLYYTLLLSHVQITLSCRLQEEYVGFTDLLVRNGIEQPIDVVRAIHIGRENRS